MPSWWTKTKEKIKQYAPIAKIFAPPVVGKGIEIAEQVLESSETIETEIKKNIPKKKEKK